MKFFKWFFSKREIVYLDDPQKETSERLVELLESGTLSVHSGMGVVTELLKRLVKERS